MLNRNFNRGAKAYLERFMEQLRKKEAYEMVLLSRGWEDVRSNLEEIIFSLATLEVKSLNQLFLEKKYKQFLIQAERELSKYSVDASQVITIIQGEFANAGLVTTQGLISTLTADFNLLPVDAINNMIGITSDGSPLAEILIKRYGENAKRAGKILVESTSLGLNPRETAKLIGASLDNGLYDTLRIARTEQMRVFREASLEQMEESGVVDGWEWITEPDACPFCESMDGKIFSLNESMDTHPNCRCVQAPHINI